MSREELINRGKQMFRTGVPDTTRPKMAVRSDVILYNGRVSDVFTVAGGPVMITAMWMQITEAVPASTLNMAWMADPTDGVLKLIGDDLDINNFQIGEFIWSECDGTALVAAQTTTLPVNAIDRHDASGSGIIVPEGGIDVRLDDATLLTGKGTLYVQYRPLVANACVWPGLIHSTTTTTSSTTSTTSSSSSTASTTSSTSSTASTTSTTTSTSSSTTTTTSTTTTGP